MWSWKRGDKITASRLNEMLDLAKARPRGGRRIAANTSAGQSTVGLRGEQIIPRRKAGTVGGKLIEVRIARVLEFYDDATDQRETDMLDLVGPHLKCHQINGEGQFITEIFDGQTVLKYVVVFANWMHPLAEFKTVNWNHQRPDAPVFTAFSGARGNTLSFGEGERWVAAPTEAAVCMDGGPQLPATGACCSAGGSCLQQTQFDCLNEGLMWQGPGTSCTPNPCPQPDPVGKCCHGLAACANVSLADCTSIYNGDWEGEGTQCGSGVPCNNWGPGNTNGGACCLPGNSCAEIPLYWCLQSAGTFQGINVVCTAFTCTGGGAAALPPPDPSRPNFFTRIRKRFGGRG